MLMLLTVFSSLAVTVFGPKTIIDKACYELPNISIFEENTNPISFLSLRKVREYAERNLSLTK
jgi:hypothetical protein